MHQLQTKKKVTYKQWRYGRGGVPCLIFSGWWLERIFGWRVGQHVAVSYQKDKIVISNAKELNQLLATKE